MDTRSRIHGFVKDELLLGGGESFADDTPLLEGGRIDSLGLMHLVTFLEEEFGIEVDDTEIVPDNFRTIEHIERLVRRRLEETAS